MPKSPLEHRSPVPARTESRLLGRNTIASAIGVGVVLWLATLFAYAPAAWAMIVYRLLVDGGILVLWLLCAAGLGAVVLRAFGGPEPDRPLVGFVTAAGLGLGAISLLVLALGLAGWLNQATAIGLLALGLVLGIAWLFRTRWSPDVLRARLAQPAGRGWLGLIVVPFAALMTIGAMLPPGILWTPNEPHGYDVVEYHLQVPREWFEAGKILPLHHNVFSFFPFNVEMHYLLAMHLRGGPWAGMYLAQFMHGAFFVLAVIAACGFANRMTRHTATSSGARFAPMTAVLAMATVPWVAQLGAIAYDEGGFILFGLLSIGWALCALQHPERALRHFALSGAFAGLACGVKLTAVPEVLLGVPLVAGIVVLTSRSLNSSRPSISRRLSGPLLCGLIGVAFFSPWVIRTAAWSGGNPVFPELATVLGHGDFDEAQIERWHNAHSPRPDQRSLVGRLHAGWVEIYANPQFGYLLIPVALASLIANSRDPQAWFLGMLFLLLTIVWLFFTHLQSRFFLLAVPVCALLIARLPAGAWIFVVAQAALGFIFLNQQLRPRIMPELVGLEDLSPTTPDAAGSVPKDETLALVGDERPFVYQRPMSLLIYRTVFDVKGDRGDIIEAFASPKPMTGHQWLLISPDELQRFARTYQPFPRVPSEITSRPAPYLMQR